MTNTLTEALRAARFLTRVAWDPKLGTFPFELTEGSRDSRISSIAGSSCEACLQRGAQPRSRIPRCRRSRPDARCWPIFRASDGIHPILALPDKQPLAWEPRWSASPGCYQLKSAIAWRELFEITGDREFECGYETALNAALENDSEFLPGEPDPLP